MTKETSIKKYPVTSNEVAKMLGIESSETQASGSAEKISTGDLPVAHLPIAQTHEPAKNENSHENEKHNHNAEPKAKTSAWLGLVKVVLPYAAVFAVGLFLYFFFFRTTDFSSILRTSDTPNTSKQSAVQQLQKEQLASYQNWIAGFYYDISDTKITDPDADNSGNGLTNFEKYLLNLNPKSYDTLGLGLADSQIIAMGISPLSGAPLSEEQKNIVSKYIDMEVVSNRLAINNLRRPPQVAGVSAGLEIRGAALPAGFQNSQNTVSPSPLSYNLAASSVISNELDINTEIPGRLEIPSLNINVPIIWSKGEKDFTKDLQMGVIHYPGTAVPGQIGTTYISGHSSNYIWAKGNYNYVFTKLGNLADNASFKITVVQKNGKDAILHYVVTHRKEYSPTDSAQYQNTGKSLVALSTCWPVGSTAKRLVVYGELMQVEK